MKFLTLEQGQLAALLNDMVVDLPAAASQLAVKLPYQSLLDLVTADNGREPEQQAWLLAQQALAENIACRPYSEITPLAPIPVPSRNIMCLGTNYLGHVKEVAEKLKIPPALPQYPIIFTKATSCVIGPEAIIPASKQYTQKLDYEAEVALIIGKGGRDISPEDAWQHVFGYTAINDISARDLQKDHKQFFRAKSLDGFGPMGPVVVSVDAMPKPDQILIKCLVNGELRQEDSFDGLIFDVPTIISTLSAGMSLQAGDIIATGTPAGVGMGTRPPRYLQAGDEVVVEISGVGQLRNTVA